MPGRSRPHLLRSGCHCAVRRAAVVKSRRRGRCMLKVLIAEDDFMIADMAEEVLVEHGYEVCGIARTVAEGVALGQRHKPDLALIDLQLADGGLGTEIVAQLSG